MALGMTDHFKECIKLGNYRITVHAFERLIERNISLDEIEEAILLAKLKIIPKTSMDQAALSGGELKKAVSYTYSVRWSLYGLLRHTTPR